MQFASVLDRDDILYLDVRWEHQAIISVSYILVVHSRKVLLAPSSNPCSRDPLTVHSPSCCQKLWICPLYCLRRNPRWTLFLSEHEDSPTPFPCPAFVTLLHRNPFSSFGVHPNPQLCLVHVCYSVGIDVVCNWLPLFFHNIWWRLENDIPCGLE